MVREMNELISLIAPVYNVNDYLDRFFESLQSQTYSNFEAILVDDGSGDGSGGTCDRMAEKDERFRVIHQQNVGVSGARNAGLDIARGKVIMFGDPDDYLEPDYLEKAYFGLREANAQVVFFGYYFEGPNGEKIKRIPQYPVGIYSNSDAIENLLPKVIGLDFNDLNAWICGRADALYVENPAVWRMAVDAAWLKKTGIRFYEDLSVGEDTLFTSQCICNAQRIHVTEYVLYHYVMQRPDGAVVSYGQSTERKLKGKITLLRHREELREEVIQRGLLDIRQYYEGTTLMSVMELFFLFAGSSDGTGRERRARLDSYKKLPEVQRATRAFSLEKKLKPRALPFLFLKLGWDGALFAGAQVLAKTGYHLTR